MDCPICLEEITDSHNQTRVHCCRGTFHTECYLKCSNPCPLCRAESFIVTEQPPQVPPIIIMEHRSTIRERIVVHGIMLFGLVSIFWLVR